MGDFDAPSQIIDSEIIDFQLPYLFNKVDHWSAPYIRHTLLDRTAITLGGYDPGGNLHVLGGMDSSEDFCVGIVDAETGLADTSTCDYFNRTWTVTNTEIQNHIQDFADNGVIDNPQAAILNWPGRGGDALPPTVRFLRKYAPFWDANGNGIYEPMSGEFSCVESRINTPLIPDDITYWVMNTGKPSGGNYIFFEIDITLFTKKIIPLEERGTIFTDIRLTNRSVEDFDSTFLTLEIEPRLGCGENDFFTTFQKPDSVHLYSASFDATAGGDCLCDEGGYGFCTEFPAIEIGLPIGFVLPATASQSGVDSFYSSFDHIGYSYGPGNSLPSGMQHPTTPQEHYNYLSGSWRDGSPFTFGGTGFQTDTVVDWMFTGNPNIDTSWNIPASGLTGDDYRLYVSTSAGRFRPGTAKRATYSINYDLSSSGNIEFTYFDSLYFAGQEYLWDGDVLYSNVKSPVFSLEELPAVYPNPTSDEIRFRGTTDEIFQYELYRISGEKIRMGIGKRIERGILPAGMYFLRLTDSEGGSSVHRIVWQ